MSASSAATAQGTIATPAQDEPWLGQLYEEQVDAALRLTEIAAALDRSGVHPDELRRHLLERDQSQEAINAVQGDLNVESEARQALDAAEAAVRRFTIYATGLLVVAAAIALVVWLAGTTYDAAPIVLISLSALLVGLVVFWGVAAVVHGQATRRYRLPLRRASHTSARTAVGEALRDGPLAQIAREYLDEERFDLQLTIEGDAPGLGELVTTRYDVSTRSQERLKQALERMQGGAVGVAGPRGAGKSTVIRSVCEGRLRVFDGPYVGVFVAAPVNYDPRDFVSHLLAETCRAVAGEALLERLRDKAFHDLTTRDRRRLGIMLSGVGGVAAGALGMSWLGVSPTDQTRIALGAVAGASTLGAVALARGTLWRRRQTARSRRRRDDTTPDDEIEVALRRRALDLYEQTKFQQSYSSGWAGSLKMPMGGSLSADGKMTWAQVQMSLPELVTRLQSFLREIASAERRVFIGIDELDKIGTPDDARAFLNGIKGIFGVRRCYFLVSVSQDAMSSFERRGMPFRDEFDSSFDEVVEAGYLRLGDTRRLLRRRVYGMSVPFQMLCHCLSGGLPRDTIRFAREMVSAQATGPALADVCRTLVAAELDRKCHAADIAAQRSGDVDSRRTLHEHVALVRDVPRTREALEAHCHAYAGSAAAALPAAMPEEGEERSLAELAFELNAFVYFCATVLAFFARPGATEGDMQAAARERADLPATLETLTQARRTFAVDPAIAWQHVERARSELSIGGALDPTQPPIPRRRPAHQT